MRTSGCLNISKLIFLFITISYSLPVFAEFNYEDIYVHGFLSQAMFHSSDNNVYGHSDDGVALGLTEIGLNISYKPWDNIRFAAQGLYRRAGNVDKGNFYLDYALADLTLFNYTHGKIGIRAGRIKAVFGVYNETRDVAFTHPTILLPQGIYLDRARSLFLSADGVQFYWHQQTNWGNLDLKLFYGMLHDNSTELLTSILGVNARGKLYEKTSFLTHLNYQSNNGHYNLALSYANINLAYNAITNDFFKSGEINVSPIMVSAQYNNALFKLTAEYALIWSEFSDFGMIFPDSTLVSEKWYVEASYRIFPELQATIRYDVSYNDKDDRRGLQQSQLSNLPAHTAFSKNWVFGLQWDVNSNWMIRGEYHRNHGTFWLTYADNPQPNLSTQDWDLFALQLSFRF